jgi:pentatricopeptide repeat protein
MPSVYSTVFQSFIRQGFSKSFTHGYAQSVVAATHPQHVLNAQNRPSFARRRNNNAPRVVGRFANFGLQSAFHTSNLPGASSLEHHRPEKPASHGGLDAYFEHLQKSQASGEAEKEWVQFQFPKRIEWKPTPASVLLGSEDAKTLALQSEESGSQDDVSTAPGVPPEAEAALAHIDAAIEKEIEARKRLEELEEKVESLRATSPELAEKLAEEIRSRSVTPFSQAPTPGGVVRTVTPPVDPQSETYADHLTKLSEAGRYAEIPAVFEAMLVGGVRPLATAYNALLMAAIHLPSEKWEIVTRALDVYADMLRRKVSPDSDTYDILVGLLASRSLEIVSLKRVLEDKRLRFGGMDEPGKFMFASHELEYAMLLEDDRLGLAIRLFETSVTSNKALYSSETYHQLISACAQAGRVSDMLQLFEHMEASQVTPFAATFPAMITAFASSGDLVSAVECYNEYRNLAIANDKGENTLKDRLDAQVYAALINAYVISDKLGGAMKFYQKIVQEYGVKASEIKDALIAGGFVKGFIERGIYREALRWAEQIENGSRGSAMGEVATVAADHGDKQTAVAAYADVGPSSGSATSAIAMLAMSVREGDVANAARYWNILRHPGVMPTASFIEPTAMYAVAMIGSGKVLEGLTQAEHMFQRIRESAPSNKAQLSEEIEEGSDFISRFMATRGITDPRNVPAPTPVAPAPPQSLQSVPASPHPSTASVVSRKPENSFDPYARTTDVKGSFSIADALDRGRKHQRLNEAVARFRNVRQAGRHPHYITYAKLISAAARERKLDLCQEILALARVDVPPRPQYPAVRDGWQSILDAMVGACITLGRRDLAEKYHQELLAMGSTLSANTYGLYITTMKESTKTSDEASEAVKIFRRAKAEGVEPSPFLYNALIGKLSKARRIDDCLFYFAEMRTLGIKPTSVTYGTIVNALCRVSNEKRAEELFDEMEAMPDYQARAAPYNCMMQFFLTTKRDKAKVLEYYERMKVTGIAPTAHTFKLLIDAHGGLEPVDMNAAEGVFQMIRAVGQAPEPVHYASLIQARGCVLHDMEGARHVFDSVMKDSRMPPEPCLFQALFEAMVANRQVAASEPVLEEMRARHVELTPYIANTLIHGWAAENNIAKAEEIYAGLGRERREPSTYEAMTRAFLAVRERQKAKAVVTEMLSRGYPNAVVNRVLELLRCPLPGEAPVVG